MDVRADLAALEDLSGCPQVRQAGIGAGADVSHIDRQPQQGHAWLEMHVIQGTLSFQARLRIRLQGGVWHKGVDLHHLLRAGAPGYLRLELRAIYMDFLVEAGALVAAHRQPIRRRLVPQGTSGGVVAALEVLERDVIGNDESILGLEFDRHIAQRGPAIHGQRAHSATSVLGRIADATTGSDLADQCKNHVLGIDTQWQLALEIHTHRLRLGLRQCLSG